MEHFVTAAHRVHVHSFNIENFLYILAMELIKLNWKLDTMKNRHPEQQANAILEYRNFVWRQVKFEQYETWFYWSFTI